LALLAVTAAFTLALPPQVAWGKLPLGATPPDALGTSLEKDAITVGQFQGKVVVVTFWASWCGPCLRELPALDALKRVAGDRVEIVAVNVKDDVRDYHAITRQLKGTGMIFTRDANGKIANAFEVDAYPNLFVIDQAGKVSRVHIGFSEDSIEEIIDDINGLLLKAAAPAAVARG
jgi:thiol-disulfide isomerase/thioredoxin